jgi:hypothetical protein
MSPGEAARHAFLQAEAERAVAPYVGHLPPDALRAFRDRAAAYLATDPQMVRLLEVAFPASSGQASTVRAVEDSGSARSTGRRRSEKKA